MLSNEQQLHLRTLARALNTVNGVTESADMSVEALAVACSTAFDISDDSRASFLPVAYSILPSGSERLAQLSMPEFTITNRKRTPQPTGIKKKNKASRKRNRLIILSKLEVDEFRLTLEIFHH